MQLQQKAIISSSSKTTQDNPKTPRIDYDKRL